MKTFILYVKNTYIKYHKEIHDEIIKINNINIIYNNFYNYKDITLINYIYLIETKYELYDLFKNNNINCDYIIYKEIKNVNEKNNLLQKFNKHDKLSICLYFNINNISVEEINIYNILQNYNISNKTYYNFNVLYLYSKSTNIFKIILSYYNHDDNMINNNDLKLLINKITQNYNNNINVIDDNSINDFIIYYSYYVNHRILINI